MYLSSFYFCLTNIKGGIFMSNTNSYKDMRVKDLKEIIKDLSDEMLIVIPVIDEDDANRIYGFRKVRTAGILNCEYEEDQDTLCLNAAADGQDIADQVYFSGKDASVKEILYGESQFENTTSICIGGFSSVGEARSFLYYAKEIAEVYGYVTMADTHDIRGTNTVYAQNKIGWTLDAFKNAKIRESGDGMHAVLLPEFDWYKEQKVEVNEPKLYLKRRK